MIYVIAVHLFNLWSAIDNNSEIDGNGDDGDDVYGRYNDHDIENHNSYCTFHISNHISVNTRSPDKVIHEEVGIHLVHGLETYNYCYNCY